MKKIKRLSIVLLLLINAAAFAQVNVDHPIVLTGTGANAKLTGIQQVSESTDAVNAQTIQQNSLVYAMATGNGNNFILNITPSINAYSAGMMFNFISNQNVTGPATLTIDNLATQTITKNINQSIGQCDIQSGQIVTVVYDGTNFQMTSVSVGLAPTTANAGPNQLYLGVTNLTTTLAANTPVIGTGSWSIVSGTSGSFSNTSSPTSTFSGSADSMYVLKWTITGTCGMTSSNVTIAFTPPKQIFTYTGANQSFTVPAGVNSIFVKMWGAGGGAANYGNGTGGSGAFVSGYLNVTPGSMLTIITGGAGIYPTSTSPVAGGFGGGGASGGSTGNADNAYPGSGGGRSAVQITPGVDAVTAGGGGGGAGPGYGYPPYGGAGGATTGSNGSDSYSGPNGPGAGTGGTTSAGGAASTGGTTNSSAGLPMAGSAGALDAYGGGGGGSGYYGGSGGGGNSSSTGDYGGGGGGSSFVANLTSVTNNAGTVDNFNGNAPPNTSDADYQAGVGVGGSHAPSNGGNGLVVFSW